jgi:ATP adenylyltransferase
MQQLWSPWRSHYVGSPEASECFLCAATHSTIGVENLVVHRTTSTIVVMNRFPYNAGHLLVSPSEHCATIGELGAERMSELMMVVAQCIDVLTELLKPDGFNVGANLGRAAGAGVPGHLHMHVVPRWNGDTNFMATIDDVRVVSSSLETLYTSIFEAFQKLHGASR